eukprot:977050-Amphidinium_carterae.1
MGCEVVGLCGHHQVEDDLKELEAQFDSDMQLEQQEFDENLVDMAGIIEGFAQYSDMTKLKEIYENVSPSRQVSCTSPSQGVSGYARGSFVATTILDCATPSHVLSWSGKIVSIASEVIEVESVNERLRQAAAQVKVYNSREALFGKDITDYSHLNGMQKEWEPFSQLWVTTYHWSVDSEDTKWHSMGGKTAQMSQH